jgi:hypothetical protein
MSKFQFRKSVVVAAISMMAAGAAFAVEAPVGNILVGPVISTTGNATVDIKQEGVNIIAKDAELSGGTLKASANALAISDTGGNATSAVNLTIQQAGGSAGANKISLNSTSVTGDAQTTETKISQGVVSADSAKVSGNKVTLTATIDDAEESSSIQISQQSNSNTATVTLGGNGAFQGILNLVQMGSTVNTAIVALNGKSGQTFNIGQNGNNNYLNLSDNGALAAVTVNFGQVSFTGVGSATLENRVSGNTADMSLGTVSGFDMAVNGDNNDISVDFSTAGNNSTVAGFVLGNDSLLDLSAVGSGVMKLYNFSIADSATVKIVAAGTGLTGNGIQINGSSTGSTSVPQVTATLGISTIVQDGENDKILIGLNGTTGSKWDVNQTGGAEGFGSTLSFDNLTNNAVIYVRQDSTAATQSATGISFTAASGSTFTLAQK